MELKRFIAATLAGIQEGVQAAIDQTKDTKGAINPSFGETASEAARLLQLVEFDLALTVVNDRDGGGEIEVISGSLGGKGKKSKDHAQVSRVQFAVPILPVRQMMGGEEPPLTAGESLRRASKVASAAARPESHALHGSESAGGAAPSEASVESVAEGT